MWHILAWPSPHSLSSSSSSSSCSSSPSSVNNLPGGASTLPLSSLHPPSSSSLQSFLLLRGESPLGHSLQAGGISITETDPVLPPLRCLLLSSLVSLWRLTPSLTDITSPLPPPSSSASPPSSFLLSSLCLPCLARNCAAKKGLSQAVPPCFPTHPHKHTHTHTHTLIGIRSDHLSF